MPAFVSGARRLCSFPSSHAAQTAPDRREQSPLSKDLRELHTVRTVASACVLPVFWSVGALQSFPRCSFSSVPRRSLLNDPWKFQRLPLCLFYV